MKNRNGAEGEIRTPEVKHHRISSPAPWARLSYLRLILRIDFFYINVKTPRKKRSFYAFGL